MISLRFGLALFLLVLFGAIVFVWQIFGSDPARAWQSFLANLLFFSAVAQSGSVLAAIHHLTEAGWGRRVMPVAIGLGSFLPISFLLFVVLFLAFPYLPTYSAEFPARQSWLNPLFLISRDLFGLAVLYTLSLVFSYEVLAVTLSTKTHLSNSSQFSGSRESLANIDDRRIPLKSGRTKNLTLLAILVLAVYAVVYSMIGFDLVMALDHQWYSTLFGGYFFMSSFYIGLAAIIATLFVMKKYLTADEQVEINALWDLGKLAFAFCLLTAYFFWSQYLITWYGNLPEEVGFFVRRFQDPAWRWLTWTTITLTFAIPFLALLSQRTKQSPALFLIAIAVLVGMWLERYLLVAPSLDAKAAYGLGWTDVVITVSFLAAVVFTYAVYLSLYDIFKSKSALEAARANQMLRQRY